MKHLDAKQQQELDAALGSESMSRRPVAQRVLIVLGVVVPFGALMGAKSALVTPRWLLTGVVVGLLLLVLLSPLVFAPRAFVRTLFLLNTVSDEDAAKPKRFGVF